MSKRLRVGVIGVGAIATDEVHGHIPNYLRVPDIELVALSDVNGRRARYVADRFEIPQVYTHYRDMLARAELDAVSICTPNYLHAAMAIGCLQAGVHVLVEKPMALTSESGRRMMEAAQQSGKQLFVGMNNRFRDDTRALKLMVANGALGRVYSAKAAWLRRYGSPGTSTWFTSKAQAGGGPLWDIGLVMLDLALWMLDFPEAEAIAATIFDSLIDNPEADEARVGSVECSPYPVEDAANALIRFKNGSGLVLEVSSASMLGVADDIVLRLDGTHGAAELHNPNMNQKDSLRIHGELFGTRMDLAPGIPESDIPSHQREVHHFVDVCLGREAPLVSPAQGLAGVQITEAIYRSAAEGRMVRLDEPTREWAGESPVSTNGTGNGYACDDERPLEAVA
ncbi:MAG: Gfo/Idh/MocA family oxidoreductase [Ardenticatenaceae bacterium]|nr:Gfo/Idh/MocA family oxidoreductase [Ardenticatenaceae bacterium]HBY99466.1 gfo/Idh/MocA family oxidoreductase [Chloroflexota bacterium]